MVHTAVSTDYISNILRSEILGSRHEDLASELTLDLTLDLTLGLARTGPRSTSKNLIILDITV